jgi:hypothetical protein
MSRSKLPPGIPEGTDPRKVVDDGVHPPYVMSDEPYQPRPRPEAEAGIPSIKLSEVATRKDIWGAVLDSVWWLIIAIVCLPGGIVVLAAGNVGVGLAGIGIGIAALVAAARTWV